jgi:hypothetical protein
MNNYEEFTVEEFQADFDNLFKRVEEGETFIILHEGERFVMAPYTENDKMGLL